ncbi:hypothetical protein AB1Y20_007283 [Prymnesium parvum]|uniref:FHA domain-containing protein n=1 Tax=Prymnesium parvum TaxID=97485 RepID=A0AB34IUH3_PRYPA
MGRHKSSLRELGWSAANSSPNPWKQGSAKRVVRTLDYSNVECEPVRVTKETSAPAPAPAPAMQPTDRAWEDRLQQLQHDGRQQLDRIREQFEEQDAENRRKLDRLNGRIAELGENKHAMWSILRQTQGKPRNGADAAANGAPSKATVTGSVDREADFMLADERKDAGMPLVDDPLEAGEGALSEQEQNLAQKEAALAQQEIDLEKAMADVARKEAAVLLAAEATEEDARVARAAHDSREALLREGEAVLTKAREDLLRREAALDERDRSLQSREASVQKAEADLALREANVAAAEDAVRQRQQQLADAAAAALDPLDVRLPARVDSKAYDAPVPDFDGAAVVGAPAAKDGGGALHESHSPTSGIDRVKQELHRSKVRFEEVRQQLMNAATAAPKGAVSSEASAGAATEDVPKQLPSSKPVDIAEPSQLSRGNTADWARSDNLAASLLRQQADPDEIFFPLPNQRTCELTDIFSAPRRRDRGVRSGDWSPLDSAPKEGPFYQLVGLEGEYSGDVLNLPLPFGDGVDRSAVLGRSSSCDVTLNRDDQISRKHLQILIRGGKLMVEDLGSTYGTRLNGKPLTAAAAPFQAGDTLSFGASTFKLQCLRGPV